MLLPRGNFTTRKGMRELSLATVCRRIDSETISRADSPEDSRGNRKGSYCALSSALLRRVKVPLALE